MKTAEHVARLSTKTLLKHVLFVAGVEEAPMRYRTYLPAEALGLFGVTSDVVFYTDPRMEELATNADLLVLHRVRATRRVINLIEKLRDRKVRVLFDVDDLVFDYETSKQIPWLRTVPPDQAAAILQNSRLYRTTMETCDAVICSTEPLRDLVTKLVGVPAYYFPNGVGLRLRCISDAAMNKATQPRPRRIGYFSGTHTHEADWQMIEPGVIDFLKKFTDVELWLVGQVRITSALSRLGERVKQVPMQAWQHLPELTRQVDINLAPLILDLDFNETKSAIKWLEAALVQVPTIASPSQPFRTVIRHGHNGMLANTVEEWCKSLELLIGDGRLRQRIGQQARQDALESFNAEKQGHRYLDILEQTVTTKANTVRFINDRRGLPDERSVPHPLEPYEMTIYVSRPIARVPTVPLRADAPLEFQIPAINSSHLRLDLHFATHGQAHAEVLVEVTDSSDGTILASAESSVSEGAWSAFDLQLSGKGKALLVGVKTKSGTQASSNRIALWADLSGSYKQMGKTYPCAPCMKLWIQEDEGLGSSLDVLDTHRPEPITFVQKTLARWRFAHYIWTVRGFRSLVQWLAETVRRTAWRMGTAFRSQAIE
jgi:Glycosyltransferase